MLFMALLGMIPMIAFGAGAAVGTAIRRMGETGSSSGSGQSSSSRSNVSTPTVSDQGSVGPYPYYDDYAEDYDDEEDNDDDESEPVFRFDKQTGVLEEV